MSPLSTNARLSLLALEIRMTLHEASAIDWTRKDHGNEPETFVGKTIARLERWSKDIEEVRAELAREQAPLPAAAAAAAAADVHTVLEGMPPRPSFGDDR